MAFTAPSFFVFVHRKSVIGLTANHRMLAEYDGKLVYHAIYLDLLQEEPIIETKKFL